MFTQALIVAALAACIEAAPARRNNDKLKNDRSFQEYAAKFNKNIQDTATYLGKQERYHKADNKIKL